MRRFFREVERDVRIWEGMGWEGSYGRGWVVSCPPIGVNLCRKFWAWVGLYRVGKGT